MPLDSCLLELMKSEATPLRDPLRPAAWDPQPARCLASEGKFAGASWDTLADYVAQQDLADTLDRELADLAKAFRPRKGCQSSLARLGVERDGGTKAEG